MDFAKQKTKGDCESKDLNCKKPMVVKDACVTDITSPNVQKENGEQKTLRYFDTECVLNINLDSLYCVVIKEAL